MKRCSSHSVSSTSCTLRRSVRALVRNSVLATCWVMVEPPCTTWPAVRSTQAARAKPHGVDARMVPEAPVLHRDRGLGQVGRQIGQVQRLANDIAETRECLAGAVLQRQARAARHWPPRPRGEAGRARTTAAAPQPPDHPRSPPSVPSGADETAACAAAAKRGAGGAGPDRAPGRPPDRADAVMTRAWSRHQANRSAVSIMPHDTAASRALPCRRRLPRIGRQWSRFPRSFDERPVY